MSSVQGWLDELISVPVTEMRSLGIRAINESGCAMAIVVCRRHDPTQSMTFVGAIRHVMTTESEWQAGAAAAGTLMREPLHKPGELRPGRHDDPLPPPWWSTSRCNSCQASVIWARTPKGKRMPVDAEPNPHGNVVLTLPGDGSIENEPLAMTLHTDGDRAQVDPRLLRTTHFQTCPQAGEWRRQR